ncbi:MAG TPA: pitrilysin family protein [Bryobacteraceae bacterium]
MKWLALAPLVCLSAVAQMRTVTLPANSPVVTVRLVFTTGAAQDPEDKPGLARLTAEMLSGGGTKDLTYKEVVEAFFPMAASLSSQVDQEMTVFFGATHIDNLDAYYKLVRAMLLEPGWREDDFSRLKDSAINSLRIGLRGNNDEELGKEVLLSEIYKGTPYGHYSLGSVSSLQKITLDDVREFYKQHYAQANLIIGIAGGYKPEFLDRLKKDFAALPAKDTAPMEPIRPHAVDHTRALIVEKNTRSVAYSFGFPIDVRRGDPDYPALLVAQSYLGQHRLNGRLFERIREIRGINYGDYAYIEYFPRGGQLLEPPPNLARSSAAFQIWIRPAEPPQAAFTLRLACYELNKLIKEGISQADFDRTKEFLSKYVNVLTKTKRAELGYAIDSLYYGIPNYNAYLKDGLAKLTREQVNAAIRKHIRVDRLQIVAVSANAEDLKRQIVGAGPSTIQYNTPKPADILAEDKIAGAFDIGLRPQDVSIVPVDKVFE